MKKEYFNQNFNKYTFNIEEFNSLPYNFIKEKYKTATFLPEETCGICYDELTPKNIVVTSVITTFVLVVLKSGAYKKRMSIGRTTGVCNAVFNDISDYYGKKINFIQNFLIKNKNFDIVIISKFEKTENTLREIFRDKKKYLLKTINILKIILIVILFFFMEELGERDKYLKYLIGSNKSFSLA